MNFISTRDKNLRKTLAEAIHCGLADDGGLFMPEQIPQIDLNYFTGELTYPLFAERVVHAFFKGDILEHSLSEICQAAFSFAVPLSPLNQNTYLLELFHGPTLSFKDFGARFLAECLNKIFDRRKTTIMVATSGDTGSAVASAFYRKQNIEVIILYPKGLISKRQEQQITCWDQNIRALAVKGTFDDCQGLVKSAFNNPYWQKHFLLSSANSINIGRLIPQITYYAYSSMQFYQQHQQTAGYIVPTGNLGNATAGYLAKLMGFPIREIILATNANRVIPDYLQSGIYNPRPSVTTLANAMDVGNPSNFERLQYLFTTFASFKNQVKAFSVNDEEIRKTIKTVYEHDKKIICPHTATACFVRQKLSSEPWIIVATADPCKFNTIIEPLIGTSVPIPQQLQLLLEKPTHILEVANNLNEIQEIILSS
ncbi:threonine synthase [Legionella drancourtii]|uniref:Threonine synthase n=1 Tax=Legionella drancourtii LLAP12 TaxID=658187 RepID=G9EKA7_9GAMM|nr:threonine synthase [Legionella drancourtii]EHL32258.1 hypothetical protein LDG_5631 [Legionella drancourtii LLAP12]